jgi:hypothetical protein
MEPFESPFERIASPPINVLPNLDDIQMAPQKIPLKRFEFLPDAEDDLSTTNSRSIPAQAGIERESRTGLIHRRFDSRRSFDPLCCGSHGRLDESFGIDETGCRG